MTSDLIGRKIHRGTHREGRDHVVTEAETGVIQLQAKESQGLSETTRNRQGKQEKKDLQLLSLIQSVLEA